MHLSSSSSFVEWRVPPSRCRLLFTRELNMSVRSTSRHTAAAAAASQQEDAVVVPIPGSREEAVSAAVAALLGQIKGLGGKKRAKKGFSASSSSSSSPRTRFSIELPLPSDSPADSAAFVAELLNELPAAAVAGAVVVCASDATAAAAAAAVRGGSSVRVLSLQAACRSAGRLDGPLVLVEPGVADVALVDQLLEEVWSGAPWALVVNPTWFVGVPQQYSALVSSWEAAYSLMITATQGLMRTEGAVLRQLAPGSSSDSSNSPWRVLLKDNRSDQFIQVGQMKHRPSQSDLELAFINAKAAQSPLTSLVKGVRGMFDKQQQQQQQ